MDRLDDLKAHARREEANRARTIVTQGQHLALALFLESQAAHHGLPREVRPMEWPPEVQPQDPEGHRLVYPWAGVVCNLNWRTADGRVATPEFMELIARLIAFRLEKVRPFGDGHAPLGVAAVVFSGGMEGYDDLRRTFEKHFAAVQQGRETYARRLASGTLGEAVYGWVADEEDFSKRGPVGDYFRMKFDVKCLREINQEAIRAMQGLVERKRDANTELWRRFEGVTPVVGRAMVMGNLEDRMRAADRESRSHLMDTLSRHRREIRNLRIAFLGDGRNSGVANVGDGQLAALRLYV